MGGLMGRPWQLYSLAKVMEITATVKIPVLGGGGSYAYDDCVRYLMAGCTIAGLCSALYSRGVGVLNECIDGLNEFMDKKGYHSVRDLEGCVVKDFRYLREWKRENPMTELTPIIPRFDESKCTMCGICETICPCGAISIDENIDKVPRLKREYCFGCGWCVGHCGHEAIECIHIKTGEVIWNGYGTIKDWVK
jgi:dihydropyrimidine dehydrogenase (NAD+) subunit PreA